MTTVLSEHGPAEIEADVGHGRVIVDPASLPDAIGWSLRPEGLCRGDVCVPVADRGRLAADGGVDLVAVAGVLGSAVTVAADDGVVAVGVATPRRAEALTGRRAPDFALPDLEGAVHRFSEWTGRRRLLVAFATW